MAVDKSERNYKGLPIEEKESYKWIKACNESKQHLSQASSITLQVFSAKEIDCLKLVNEALQEDTAKSKNTNNPDKLAWATWIIARLGGWKTITVNDRQAPSY